MLLVSDVHGATAALRKVAAQPGTLLVLGDLINFIDYRTYEGLVTEVSGRDFVIEMVRLRTAGDDRAAGELWRRFSAGREAEVYAKYDELVAAAYVDICSALEDATGYVIYGNVDRPEVLRAHLPAGMKFVDAEAVDIEGFRVGFAGGGMKSPLGVAGEVTEDQMAEKLAAVGPVDVLCTHVPPMVGPLTRDVIGGRTKGSKAILDYLFEHRPAYHYFGDIHQPQAWTWRVGRTTCRNVGYFRATGRAVHHG